MTRRHWPPTDPRHRVVAGRTIGVVAVGLGAFSIAGVLGIGFAEILVRDYLLHQALPAIVLGSFTLVAVPRQPFNNSVWVGAWAALAAGIGAAGYSAAVVLGVASGVPTDYEALAALAPADLPTYAAVGYSLVGFVLFAYTLLLTDGFLLFPDGELPSRRWRWAVWASIVVGIGFVVSSADAFGPRSTTPMGASSDQWTGLGTLQGELTLAMVVLSVVCLVPLVSRYRASTGLRRQQYRWIAFGGGIFVLVLLWLAFSPGPLVPDAGQARNQVQLVATLAAELALLTGYAMAVGRYRLYDIDLVLNRTVVLAVLAGFITLSYAVVVVGLGGLIGGGGTGFLPSIAATAVVAVAFEPVRLRAQRWANRLVYGSRATPYEVLSDVTERLATAEAGSDLLARLAQLLVDGTGAESARVWLGPPGRMSMAAHAPPDAAGGADQPGMDGDTTFAVSHAGEVVGALEVRKPRGSVLSSPERGLVVDLAGSAGAVLGYQRLNDSLAAKAAELEQSKARLVGAQDQERRRLERELHEGAEQYIVALKVKLGVAAQLASKEAAPDLVSLLEGLTGEAQAALDDVRSLAKGIYPPILESDGLGAAISALAAAGPVDIRFERDGIGRYEPDVEAAVYFDISEAVTNAVKHAEPPIHVTLAEDEGRLVFSVVDEGPGFDPHQLALGSGLENMVDRLASVGGLLTIDSGVGRSTHVHGEIPVRSSTPR